MSYFSERTGIRNPGGTLGQGLGWVEDNPEIAAAAAMMYGGGAMSGAGGGANMLPMLSSVGGALSANRDEREGIRRNLDRAREGRSWTEYDPKSFDQINLEQNSYNNFQAQQALQDSMAAQYGRRMGLENLSGNFLQGDNLGPNAREMALINQTRNDQIAYDQDQIGKLLDERLSDVSADTARRGVRGQARAQLETGAMDIASQRMQDSLNQANIRANQMQLSLPEQRLGFQQSAADRMANYGSNSLQQGFNNRAALQNPALLQMLRQDRQNAGVNVAPTAAYSQLLMADAGLNSDLTAGLKGFNSFMGTAGGMMAGGMGGLGGMMGGGATGGLGGGMGAMTQQSPNMLNNQMR